MIIFPKKEPIHEKDRVWNNLTGTIAMRMWRCDNYHSNQHPYCPCHRHSRQHRSANSAADHPPTPTITPLYPPEGYGPANFPANVDPLTGLPVSDPALLQRRPMLIKVSNLPRNVRPQWGLSLADLIFEYYTEEGSTRFAAIFYSKDASMVGPIRSGRFIDGDLVQGYKAVFAFGSAYVAEMQRFQHGRLRNPDGGGGARQTADALRSEWL